MLRLLIRFRRWFIHTVRDRLLAFVMGVGIAFVLLCAVCLAVMLLPQFISNLVEDHKDFFTDDAWLGHKFNPNVRDQFTYPKGGDVIIQTTDEFGRRTTVQPAGDDYSSFAIFAPDSMLFGVNVNDDQTVASQFARITAGKKIKAYNYAVSGYGPNHFLALMTDPRFPPGISEKKGFVVYSFIDLHIERAACWPFFFIVDPNTRLPRYVLAEDGSVQRAGVAIAKDVTYGANLFSDDAKSTWLGPYSDTNRRLAARILGQAKAEFQKRFDSQGFIVIFLNGSRSAKRMTELLEPLGIHCLDYQSLVAGWCGDEPCLQPENSHPTASGNYAIAKKLVQDLAGFGVLP